MKQLNQIIIFIFLLISGFSTAQFRYKASHLFKIKMGMNVIDDSFTKKHVLFAAEEKWNITYFPSFLGLEILLNENVSIEGNLSYNKYQKNKLVDGLYSSKEATYTAVDANIKYDLSNLTWRSDFLYFFDPYVFGGTGITTLNNEPRITLNYGFGTYVWFKNFVNTRSNNEALSHFGIFIQTQGKSSLNQKKYGNQIQHSVGLTYRFN